MIDISQSRILLTGASSGIGRELAKVLAEKGARLVVAARRRELLVELASEIENRGGPKPHPIRADLSRRGEARRLAKEAEEALGHVDVLINNAGGGVGGGVWAIGDRDEGRAAFEINYWSPMALIHEVVPGMEGRGTGAIVNVTSGAGEVSWPGFGGYAATKSALSSASRTLRMELIGTGIHVLEVVAGPIDTEVQGETRTLPGIEKMLDRMPLGQPEVMARRIVAALEREKNHLFYPRAVEFAYALPMVVRWSTERAAAQTARTLGPDEWNAVMSFVAQSGSMGHDLAQQAREDWRRFRENRLVAKSRSRFSRFWRSNQP